MSAAEVGAAPAPAPSALVPAVVAAHRRRATPLQHTLIGGGAGVLEVCIMQPTVCMKNALQVRRSLAFSATPPHARVGGAERRTAAHVQYAR